MTSRISCRICKAHSALESPECDFQYSCIAHQRLILARPARTEDPSPTSLTLTEKISFRRSNRIAHEPLYHIPYTTVESTSILR
jgi:hypothetical protein